MRTYCWDERLESRISSSVEDEGILSETSDGHERSHLYQSPTPKKEDAYVSLKVPVHRLCPTRVALVTRPLVQDDTVVASSHGLPMSMNSLHLLTAIELDIIADHQHDFPFEYIVVIH